MITITVSMQNVLKMLIALKFSLVTIVLVDVVSEVMESICVLILTSAPSQIDQNIVHQNMPHVKMVLVGMSATVSLHM